MLWLQRPLTHQLKIGSHMIRSRSDLDPPPPPVSYFHKHASHLPAGAAQNCLYLLALMEICEKALRYHYQAGLQTLLSVVRCIAAFLFNSWCY